MNNPKPYNDEKWANYLKKAKAKPYLFKVQSFGSIVLKNNEYKLQKKYIYSEFITEIQKWMKRDETTVLVDVEGSREAEGLIAFQVEMRNYDPMSNPSPHQWYIMTIRCKVPEIHKNILLTKSYAFKLKSGSIIMGGFIINDIANEASQKLIIAKPNFQESGGEFGWIKRGKAKKSTVKEVLELFNKGELLALFTGENWGRHGKTTVLK